MNHAQLKAFHVVAREGSFTKAAEAAGLTQPTLSAQVKALEESYSVRLFERRARRVTLTDQGQALFEITARLFAIEAEAEQLLSSARGLTRGQLRLAADAPAHIIPLLAQFNRRHPGIRLSMTFGNSEEVLNALSNREADVAVLAENPSSAQIYARPFRRDEVAIFVPRGHPWYRRRSLHLSELAGQRLILRESGSVTRRLVEQALTEQQIEPDDILEFGSREAVGEAVAAGLGIGAVFASEFGHDPRLHLLTLRGTRLEAQEFAACLAERRATPIVQAFFALL
jgi:aminoethylphosphonate catabolism LysR family transcriptional regulator